MNKADYFNVDSDAVVPGVHYSCTSCYMWKDNFMLINFPFLHMVYKCTLFNFQGSKACYDLSNFKQDSFFSPKDHLIIIEKLILG